VRLLQSQLTQLNLYDIARFGCEDFFAGEPLPQSPDFADGQGAGLWKRRFGTRDELAPIAGSEAMRIYQLGVLRRGDGVETLVGLGMRTADLFAGEYPLPQRWALKTPNPLMIFHSSDGVTWQEYSLGGIERGDGDKPLSSYHAPEDALVKEEDNLSNFPDSVQNALMNSTAQWRSGLNESGDPCLWTCSGTHLIEWDGWDARITPLASRATALALLHGRFYLSSGSRTSVTGANGLLAFTDLSATSLGTPKAGDERIVLVSPGANLITLKTAPGQIEHLVQGVGAVGGQWLILVSKEWISRAADGQTATQELAAFTLPELPTEPLEISTANLEYVELSNPQEYFDLGRMNPSGFGIYPPDPMAIRRSSGRAYFFQRRDLQDKGGTQQISDMERETSPLLEMLCNPSLTDFDLTAAIPYGEGHLLGTGDGYILSARLAQNRLSALARLDAGVLRLLERDGHFYALTQAALWHSENGTQWEVLREASTGHQWRDALMTSDGRLFVVSNGAASGGAPNSYMAIYDATGAFVREDLLNTFVFDTLAKYAGNVFCFGTDSDGDFYFYDAANVSALGNAPLLASEDVTAAASDANALWLGTQSGKLFSSDGAAWALEATAAHSIGTIKITGDGTILIGYADGAGAFGAWDGAALQEYSLSSPCARDAKVFLDGDGDDGGSGSDSGGLCNSVILTDAGPVFWNCAHPGDGEWFSTVRQCEPGEEWDEVLAAPLAKDGSILTARAFVGPATAGDDLTQYQPLEPGVRVRLLQPLSALRFAVVHPIDEIHTQYEFACYRRRWDD
jgi:hypothetical protein